MSSIQPYISVETKRVPPSDPTLPPLALQVTQLLDSYMLWVGTTEEPAEDVQHASLHGHLARDWACAMPASKVSPDEMLSGNCRMPRNWLIGVVQLNANTPPAATSLYRSSSSDTALSMSQRLGDILFLHLILGFC